MDLRLASVTDRLLDPHSASFLKLAEQKRLFPAETGLVVLLRAPGDAFDRGFLGQIEDISEELRSQGPVKDVINLSGVRVPDTRRLIPPIVSLIDKYGDTTSGRALLERETRFTTGISLISPGDDYALLHIIATHPNLDDRTSIELLQALHDVLKTTGKEYHIAGQAAVRDALVAAAIRDTWASIAVTAFITMLVLLILYRSVLLVLYSSAVYLCGIVLTAGVMSCFQVTLNNLTVLLAPLLVVLGVATSIHVIASFQRLCADGASRSDAAYEALLAKFKPCLLAALTTASGFLALATSSTPLLVEFALCAAAGVGILFLLTVTLLPAFLALGTGKTRCVVHTGLINKFLGNIDCSRPGITLTFAILAGGFFAAGLMRTNTNTVILDVFKPGHDIVRAHDIAAGALGGVALFDIIVKAPTDSFKKVEAIHWLDALGFALQEDADVTEVLSLATVMTISNSYYERKPFGPGTAPETQKRLDQLFKLMSEKKVDANLSSFVTEDFGTTRLIVRAYADGSGGVLDMAARLEDILTPKIRTPLSFYITGQEIAFAEAIDGVVRDQTGSFLIVVLAVAAMTLIAFHSLLLTIIVLATNLLPVVIVFGAMGWTGIPIDFFNVMVACIALGIVIDDTMHFLAHYSNAKGNSSIRATIRLIGVPIVVTSLLLGSGFLSIAFSASLAGTVRFTLLTALAVFVALVATLWLLPALLYIRRRYLAR